jgi:hypothetical protein
MVLNQGTGKPMPKSFFVVRATIADPAQRAAFDKWYAQEHLPDAVKAFGAQKAWRFWSESDPAVHQATYQFADRAALDHGTAPENMKRLVADFDKAWPGIPRAREIFTLVQEFDGS